MLQVYVFFKVKDARSLRAISSIIISALSAGFVSASVSFDYDVDPLKRKETPGFYGYIPDGMARTVIFGCMIVNSACLLLSRSVAVTLLALVDKRYLALYWFGDMAIYLLQKMVRDDFHYWVPLHGMFGLAVSVVARMMVKSLVDYVGTIQFRAAGEMGGIYWTFSVLTSAASPFAVIALYYTVTSPDKIVLGEHTATQIVSLLSGAWFASFAAILLLMEREYLRTFISTQTGNEWAVSFFLTGDTDVLRLKPLRLNKQKWKKIEAELREFVEENWERWEEEEPDWFTEVWKSRVPDDWLPPAELRRMKTAGGGERRRSSLGELLGSTQGKRGSTTVVPVDPVKDAAAAERKPKKKTKN